MVTVSDIPVASQGLPVVSLSCTFRNKSCLSKTGFRWRKETETGWLWSPGERLVSVLCVIPLISASKEPQAGADILCLSAEIPRAGDCSVALCLLHTDASSSGLAGGPRVTAVLSGRILVATAKCRIRTEGGTEARGCLLSAACGAFKADCEPAERRCGHRGRFLSA